MELPPNPSHLLCRKFCIGCFLSPRFAHEYLVTSQNATAMLAARSKDGAAPVLLGSLCTPHEVGQIDLATIKSRLGPMPGLNRTRVQNAANGQPQKEFIPVKAR